MNNKLIIGLLIPLFIASPIISKASGTSALSENISDATLVIVAILVMFAIYASIKAYGIVVDNIEQEIKEKNNI